MGSSGGWGVAGEVETKTEEDQEQEQDQDRILLILLLLLLMLLLLLLLVFSLHQPSERTSHSVYRPRASLARPGGKILKIPEKMFSRALPDRCTLATKGSLGDRSCPISLRELVPWQTSMP
jgi:hypothetical protein